MSIYFDKERRIGKAVWSGHLRGMEFREASLLCLDLVDRYELLAWLSDNRKMNSVKPADLQWSLEVLVPQLVESHLLRMAILPSEFEESRNAMGLMLERKDKLDQRPLMRNFDSEEEAMVWLQGEQVTSV